MHTLKEHGATTPSDNSLRLTHNIHTLKEPLSVEHRLLATTHSGSHIYAYTKRTSERGAPTPSNNSLRLTHNMHTLKEPLSVEQRLQATTHCRHALHVRTYVHINKHTGTDTLDGSQTQKSDDKATSLVPQSPLMPKKSRNHITTTKPHSSKAGVSATLLNETFGACCQFSSDMEETLPSGVHSVAQNEVIRIPSEQ